MLRARVIPCLLLRNSGLVKTIRFNDPKYVGDPINAVKIFNEKEVDELVLLDIEAARTNGPNFELIAQIASEAFMPLCYGGGISTVSQAEKLIKLGVEKISVNTAALRDISLISNIAAELGSQSVVAGIDVKKDWFGRYQVFDPLRRKLTGIDPVEYAKKVAKAGAGEIFLNNVNADGTQAGYDLTPINLISRAVNIPLIACGGAANINHFCEAVTAGASAVAAGSMFVFEGRHRAVLITYPSYKELEQRLGMV
jgi:cyclase